MDKGSNSLNPRAIFSKTGKGVQEASGKTSHLSRADRAVLKEIDGKTTLADVATKFEKIAADKFDALVQQLDKDGFIREVSSGVTEPVAPRRPAPAPPPPGRSTPSAGRAAPPSAEEGDALDFTQAVKLPPKAPSVDIAAAAHAEAERKAKEQAFDFKARQEAEARAKAEAEAKARAEAEAKARAEAEARARAAVAAAAEAKARAEAEAKARAEAEAKARAESEAKVKAAREAAMRLAAEAKAKTEAAERRAREEAEARTKAEAEMKARLEEERKAREEAERRAAEAAERARKELEETSKREAEALRRRLEAEMKAKLEEERKAREEEDRKRRKEEEERRAKEEAERRAREEADRKRRDEEEKKRRKEEEERRAKEEAERRARDEEDRRRRKEEEERRAKEEAGRRAREEEDRKRRAREDEERRAREEADRKRRDEEERKRREEEERKAREQAEASARAEATAPPAAPAAASGGGAFGDLLADLDSFTQREDEERKAKEEADRKAKEETERRAREEEERRRREEEEKRRRKEEERRAKEEAERRAKEEAERREREEQEEQERQEAERKRRGQEALAAKQAEQEIAAKRAAAAKPAAKGEEDIGVTDEDLDMEDVRRDEKVLSKEARKREAERVEPPVVAKAPRPMKWGRPAAIALFVILIGGVGALNVMPVSTAEYEKAAAEALGAPVKIASARLSVLTSVEVRLEGVQIGDAVKIRLARGFPEIGSLFGARKAFSRFELEGASLTQGQVGEAAFGKLQGDNFRIRRVVVKQAKLEGPLALPALDLDATVAGDGSLQSLVMTGPEKLTLRLAPTGSEMGFEISAASLALPFVPALVLSDFGMKGTASRQGVTASEFDGRVFDGVLKGTARIRWGSTWTVDGNLSARSMKVAVFAPTLVSQGKVEGQGKYSMSGANTATLYEGARLEGDFKIENGVIGNFNLRRALETGGAQTSGSTEFAEMTGQGVYERGTVQLRNLAFSSGAMNAGASLDIAAGGALAGRIAADVKTPNQTLRAVLGISGKLQDPVIHK